MVICLERGADCLHNVQRMPLPFQTQGSRGDGISIPIHTPYPRQTCPNPIVSCLIEIQTGFTFPVPAYPACAGKEAVRRVCSSSSIDIVDSFTAAYTETYSSRPRPQLPGSPPRNPGDWLRKSIGSDGRPSGRVGRETATGSRTINRQQSKPTPTTEHWRVTGLKRRDAALHC